MSELDDQGCVYFVEKSINDIADKGGDAGRTLGPFSPAVAWEDKVAALMETEPPFNESRLEAL